MKRNNGQRIFTATVYQYSSVDTPLNTPDGDGLNGYQVCKLTAAKLEKYSPNHTDL
nr:hypothetical protein [Bacteroidota bacterium]